VGDDDDDCTTVRCINSLRFVKCRAVQWHPRQLFSLRFVLVVVVDAYVVLLLVMLPRRRRHGVAIMIIMMATATATAIHLYHMQC
jgi:hypothetical protein